MRAGRTRSRRGARRVGLVAAVAAVLLAACGTPPEPSGGGPGTTATSSSPVSPASPQPSAPSSSGSSSGPGRAAPEPGSVPPAWLGRRALPTTAAGYGARRPTPAALRERRFTLPDRLPMLPGRGFASRVTSPAPAPVIARSTWVPGCPVAASELAWVRLTFWGFDDARHTGELLVNAAVAGDVVAAFRDLYRARFPIEEMRITTRAELDAPPTGDGNDTAAFTCRPKAGQTSGFSEHAYGLAIDVNPFQNPYLKSGGGAELVLPELASSYLRRERVRPGMITADGPVVRAFARVDWGWGGAWRTLKDYQHFALHDR